MCFWTLLIFFFVLKESIEFSIPVLKVKGSHYQVFKAVGAKFENEISSFLDQYKTLNDTLIPFYNDHNDQYQIFVKNLQKQFPQYFDEILGLSDGSKISFHLIFLLQIRSEVEHIMRGPTSAKAEEDCTDIHVNFEGGRFEGHNEDGNEIVRKLAYFLDAEIEHDNRGYPSERWISYCYPGVLPGIAFGWTKKNLVLSGNAVTPKEVNINGVPKVVVYRHSLTGNDLSDTIQKIIDLKERSFGCNINVGDLVSGRQVLIETAPHDIAVHEVINSNFSHTNNYKLLNIPYVVSESSTHRQTRIDEFKCPRSDVDIREILGDTKDPKLPLYRSETLATVIYNFQKKKAYVYTDNPKTTDPVQEFDLTFNESVQ